MVFAFDRDLFVSKVYERALRVSLKDSIRRQRSDTTSFESQMAKRSKDIDRELEEDLRRLRRECKVLLLGTADSGKGEIVKQMKIGHQNGYTVEELCAYRLTIYRNVVDSAKHLVEAMRQFDIVPELEPNKEHCDYLMLFVVDPDTDVPLGQDFGKAVNALWTDPCISRLLERSSECYLMDSAA